jgi:hypothetical protein
MWLLSYEVKQMSIKNKYLLKLSDKLFKKIISIFKIFELKMAYQGQNGQNQAKNDELSHFFFYFLNESKIVN